MSARVPAVVEVDPGHRWEVESRSFAPGTTWTVTYLLEVYATDEGRERSRWEMRCPCPHGERQLALPLDARTPCAHMQAVVDFTAAKHRRPPSRFNPSMFVD